MKPERFFERRPSLLLVAVGEHDRGVQPDHRHPTQVPASDPSGRDSAMPVLDLFPHVLSYPRPGRRDLSQPTGGDLLQRPPHRGVRGHRGEQLALMAQGVDLADRRATISDHHRKVREHPTPIMHGPEPRPGQRRGQRTRQPHPISRQPQQSRPDMRHHAMPADFYGQALGPRGNIHLKSASRVCGIEDFEDPYSRSSEALFAYQNTHPTKIFSDLGE